jgi:hypothetical protein
LEIVNKKWKAKTPESRMAIMYINIVISPRLNKNSSMD